MLSARAILFDLDGTLVDSTARIQRTWANWCGRHGFPIEEVKRVMHGRRGAETIRIVAPHLDVARELAALEADEISDLSDVTAYAGVVSLLRSLPAERWAIATSGSTAIAHSRITHTGLPPPRVLITAND